ncbi:MAG: NUDIX domain-containing protein [Candidatus ainarchaeum sp.]|nr:NUDIX domain-containing protein [Candidatus ainarchaeum sp.]
MDTKICVGAIIYNDKKEIFLMTSIKWKGYIVPGGEILNNETEINALKRTIFKKLGIEIENIQKIGEKIKQPSSDFIKNNSLRFKFIDFFAKAKSNDIEINKDIKTYNWFNIDYALKNLELLDTTREFIETFKLYLSAELI